MPPDPRDRFGTVGAGPLPIKIPRGVIGVANPAANLDDVDYLDPRFAVSRPQAK